MIYAHISVCPSFRANELEVGENEAEYKYRALFNIQSKEPFNSKVHLLVYYDYSKFISTATSDAIQYDRHLISKFLDNTEFDQ